MATDPMLMKAMMNSGNDSDNRGIIIAIVFVALIVGYLVLAYFAGFPPFSSSETVGFASPPPGTPATSTMHESGTRPGRPTGFSAQYETVSGNRGEILLTIEIPSSSRNLSNLWVSALLYSRPKSGGGNWDAYRWYSSKVSLIHSKFHMDTWELPFRLIDTDDYEVGVRLWNGQPEFDSSAYDFKYSDTPHSEEVRERVTGSFATEDS